jgi:hypothetical protein
MKIVVGPQLFTSFQLRDLLKFELPVPTRRQVQWTLKRSTTSGGSMEAAESMTMRGSVEEVAQEYLRHFACSFLVLDLPHRLLIGARSFQVLIIYSIGLSLHNKLVIQAYPIPVGIDRSSLEGRSYTIVYLALPSHFVRDEWRPS